MRHRRLRLLALALLLAGLAILVLAPSLDRDPPVVVDLDPGAGGGRAVLAADAPGSLPAPQPEASDAAGSARAPLAAATRKPLAPTGISGRVADRSGSRIAGARVIVAPAPTEESLAALRARGLRPLDRARLSHLPLDLAGAQVLGLETVELRTDAQGRFAATSLAPGRYRIAVRADAHAPWDRNDLLLAAGAEAALGTILLDTGSVLAGTVRDAHGPVAEARLTRVDDFGDPALALLAPALGTELALTDAHGRFVVGALAPGRSRLLVTSPEHVETLVEVDGERASLAIVLERGERLRGDVVADAEDIARLSVWSVPASAEPGPLALEARADARQVPLEPGGRFTFEALRAGTAYDLRVVSPAQRFEDECPWSPRRIAIADRRARARLVYRADASLVFDLRSTSGAVDEFEVEIEGATPARAFFDAARTERRIDGVRPLASARGRDSARVAVQAPGFARHEQEVSLRPGLESGLGTLTLEPLVRVEVLVLDAADGRPYAGALVRAVESFPWRDEHLGTRAAFSDGRGIARVTSFGARDSGVVVSAPGRATVRLAGPFTAGSSDAQLVAELVPAVVARVRVVDIEGRPLPGAQVEHVEGEWTPNDGLVGDRARLARPGAPSTTALSDHEGGTLFEGLARGIHVFRVVHARKALDAEWSLIEVTRETELELLLATEAHARLEVALELDGEPLAAARATLLEETPALVERAYLEAGETLPAGVDARTDERGSFVLENLVPGVRHLVVELPGAPLRALRTVRIGPGTNRLRLELGGERHTIAGRVLDADGLPVASVELFLFDRADEDRAWRIADDDARSDELASMLARFPASTRSPASRTDEDGTFVIRGVVRAAEIALGAFDGAGRSAVVRDLAREDLVDLFLTPGGSLRVRVTDPRPGVRHRVVATPIDADAIPRVARTLSDLPVTWNALAAGGWSVRVWTEDVLGRVLAAGPPLTVTVVAGETTSVEKELP